MGTGKRSPKLHRQSHRSTCTFNADARVHFSSLPNLRSSGLETKREKVFTYLPAAYCTRGFRILIFKLKKLKECEQIEIYFQIGSLLINIPI